MRYGRIGAVLLLAAVPLAALAQGTSQPSSQAATSESREKVRAACAGDVQKFCANIEHAKGARRSCLAAHENDLSTACKAARAERAAERANRS